MTTPSNKTIVRRERCPRCAEEGRDTAEDNLAVYADGHTHCFSCSHHSVPKAAGGMDEPEPHTFQFVPLRCITKNTLETYRAFTKVDPAGQPVSIGFRYPNGDVKVRWLDRKDFYWQKNGSSEPIGLFGQDLFTPGGHKYVTITEGELDALSLHQVLGGPVVSVSSATAAGTDCSRVRSWLNSYERIYLCFDNDTHGRDATRDVAKLFDYNKVYDVRLTHRKDANEYLQHGEGEQLRHIWWNAKKYLPDTIISTLEDFKKAISGPPKIGVSYPFKRLTDMTYGIRTGETVLVTAQEKVGKTEFMHAILYNLLKETSDDIHIGGLFHEEPNKRTLEALAGIHLGRPVHLPDSGVTDAQKDAAIDQIVRIDDRLHLYTHFGSPDPEDVLDTLRFLAAARSCKYIIWDHPGMAVFGVGTDNERSLLDYLANRSEMMVKELDYGLIVVMHVNDQGQIRGSRYFGKTCDLRIDLSRDTASECELVRNTVHVKIPYGRFSGESGPVGSYLFDIDTQRYTEVANDNDPNVVAEGKAA